MMQLHRTLTIEEDLVFTLDEVLDLVSLILEFSRTLALVGSWRRDNNSWKVERNLAMEKITKLNK